MHLVEVWFGIIERQAIYPRQLRLGQDLNAKIGAFVEGWDDRCRPFVWTKTANEILNKTNPKKTSDGSVAFFDRGPCRGGTWALVLVRWRF